MVSVIGFSFNIFFIRFPIKIKSVSPAQMVIKIINDEMISLLSPTDSEAKLNLNSSPPVNILIVGLQGSGKTTASAKLALKLKKQNNNWGLF
jgi:signal recognition particle subunit SRP54